jgi:hypothetical protein
MKNKDLETKILALADRAGIDDGRVFEVAKSEDTNAVNAYVNGFGATKRIVLWDTAIAKLDERELLFVMGHEMGHYVLGHVWQLILFFSALVLATLYVIHRTAGWLIARYRDRFRLRRLADVASLPLLILLFSVYFLIVSPPSLAFFATSNTRPTGSVWKSHVTTMRPATAFVKLQQENLAVPRPDGCIERFAAITRRSASVSISATTIARGTWRASRLRRVVQKQPLSRPYPPGGLLVIVNEPRPRSWQSPYSGRRPMTLH